MEEPEGLVDLHPRVRRGARRSDVSAESVKRAKRGVLNIGGKNGGSETYDDPVPSSGVSRDDEQTPRQNIVPPIPETQPVLNIEPPQPTATVEPPQPKTQSVSPILRWTAELNDVVRRAAQPLLNTLGAASVRLQLPSERWLLSYGKGDRLEVVQPARTVEEWVRVNQHLGSDILDKYLASVTTEQWEKLPELQESPNLDACFDIRALDRDSQRVPSPRRANDTRIADAEATVRMRTQERDQAADEAAQVRSNYGLGIAGAAQANRAENTLQAAQRALEEAERVLRQLREQASLQDDVARARAALAAVRPEQLFGSAWVYAVLPDAALQRMASPSAWAALQMAAGWVQRQSNCQSFTLRELMCADNTVMDHFALVVAYQYLSTADAAGPTQPRKGRGRSYVNLNRVREELQARMYVCAVWFETEVRARPHPLLAQFDERLPAATRTPQQEAYRAQLPQRELYAR